MTEPRLDPQRIEQLRGYAEGGVTPIDPMAIATAAMATRSPWLPSWNRRMMRYALLGLLLLTTIGLVLVVGSGSLSPPPPLFTSIRTPDIGWGSVATRLQDGRVLIVGTLHDETQVIGDPAAWIWDPSSADFQRTGGPTTARQLPVAAMLPDGRVLVAGGGTWTDRGEGVGLATAEVYDPVTGTFAPTGPMTVGRGWNYGREARVRPFAVPLGDGRVLVVGGRGSADESGRTAIDIYEPGARRFHRVADVQGCGDGRVTPVLLTDGRALMRCMDATWLFDPTDDSVHATGTWTIGDGDEPAGVSSGSANLLADGRVLFTGAMTGALRDGRLTDDPAEVYDPVTGTLSALDDATNPRPWPYGISVALRDGRVMFLDGEEALLFDPVIGTFAPIGDGPEGIRVQGTVTLLEDGRALIVGSGGDADVAIASVLDPTSLIDRSGEGGSVR